VNLQTFASLLPDSCKFLQTGVTGKGIGMAPTTNLSQGAQQRQ